MIEISSARGLTEPSAPSAADAVAATGFTTRTDLGQYFLRSEDSALRLLASAAIPKGRQVLEVGAGLGTLSLAAASAGHPLWAVEKDDRLRAHLTGRLSGFGEGTRVTIADVRAIDLDGGLAAGTHLLAIMPFDADLSTALTRHVFASPRVERGLVVITRQTMAQLDEEGSGLRLEEVDGISRSDFWPSAPSVLRVVAIERG